MIQPSDLGAPAYLSTWRPSQAIAFEQLVRSPKRFSGGAIATGVGKSLLAWSVPRLMGSRYVVATGTRGLMDQYESANFPDLVGVRGLQNYPCRALPPPVKCDAGPCLDGDQCQWQEEGCYAFDAQRRASRSPGVVTNYAFWFAHQDPVLGPRDLLVCDEAHMLASEICKAAGCTFTEQEVDLPDGCPLWDLAEWRRWAETVKGKAAELLRRGTLLPTERRDVRSLHTRAARLADADESWAWEVVTESRMRKARFEPISPRAWAEPLLFRGIPRVILLSAVLRSMDLLDLGLAESDFDFYEHDSPFPVAKRPIYAVEVGTRVTAKTSPTNLLYQLSRVDQYIDPRVQRAKGIVHSVSYPRAEWIKAHSRHGKHMLIHTSAEARRTVERFRSMKPPAILVSPTVHTGWDFPYDQARWQVVAKVPFPDCRTGIARARKEHDRLWDAKVAISTLVQTAGRVMRAEDDCGETAIFDDSLTDWLYPRFRRWFPRWFRAAYEQVVVPPPPMW